MGEGWEGWEGGYDSLSSGYAKVNIMLIMKQWSNGSIKVGKLKNYE